MRARAVIVWAVTLLLALLAPEGADASQSMSTYTRWIRVDYYGALNVTSSANATEIRGKYRRLALQYHPDKLSHLPKSKRRKAEENFKIIAEGKEVLSDPGRREEYDRVISGLPSFARPRWGRRSVFDKEEIKFGVGTVLVSFFTVGALFVSVNQYANQKSDKLSIIRSEYYQNAFKQKRKALEKKRDKSMSDMEPEDWFYQFLWDERIVYREGFKWTFLGKILWFPYEYVTGNQARLDREREEAIQKEIDDIAAEKAAKEARLAILRRGGKTKAPKKEITPEERARKEAEREAQRLRQRQAEEELRAERKRQVRARILEKIRSGDAAALSDRARKYLEDAGAPVSTDEDLCAAVEEEDHFARMFDECVERAAVDDRVARAEAQRAAQAAADAAKEDELFGEYAAPPSDGDDANDSDDDDVTDATAVTEVTETATLTETEDDIHAVKRSSTNTRGDQEGESAYNNAYNAAEDEELLAMEAEKRAKRDAAKEKKAAAAAAAKAANREQKRQKKKGK